MSQEGTLKRILNMIVFIFDSIFIISKTLNFKLASIIHEFLSFSSYNINQFNALCLLEKKNQLIKFIIINCKLSSLFLFYIRFTTKNIITFINLFIKSLNLT